MVAATFKRAKDADQNCAFLCHVSTRTTDHAHIVELLRKYKNDLATGLKSKNQAVANRLKAAYDDLSSTHVGLRSSSLSALIQNIEFFSPGITVKLANGETDEDVAVKSPYNLFVGGNNLGRGVTIKNLLVSYYGRHPRKPQADTVLQHARMYGYRRKDIGLLRLFLPRELHTVFKAIAKMERGLRDLIAKNPSEEFRGVYVESRLSVTRKSILALGSIGVYSAGSNYNPAQVIRDNSISACTTKIDYLLRNVKDKQFGEMSVADMKSLVSCTRPDESQSEHVWNPIAVAESLEQFAKLNNHVAGYVYMRRDSDLRANRRETQGIMDSEDYRNVPRDKIQLFLLRTKPGREEHASRRRRLIILK
jgi:hypothetical protein